MKLSTETDSLILNSLFLSSTIIYLLSSFVNRVEQEKFPCNIVRFL